MLRKNPRRSPQPRVAPLFLPFPSKPKSGLPYRAFPTRWLYLLPDSNRFPLYEKDFGNVYEVGSFRVNLEDLVSFSYRFLRRNTSHTPLKFNRYQTRRAICFTNLFCIARFQLLLISHRCIFITCRSSTR